MCPIRFAPALLRLMGLVYPSWAATQAARISTVTVAVSATSHAVLPGVSVEATNPPLIERRRSATTNEPGRYSIANLRTSSYAVFTAQGWELAEENL
jgi:hypothetical protein